MPKSKNVKRRNAIGLYKQAIALQNTNLKEFAHDEEKVERAKSKIKNLTRMISETEKAIIATGEWLN